MARLIGGAIVAVSAWGPAVHAQPGEPASDLSFPKEAKELSFFSPLAMGIWKPKGDGPFPAVILVHTCGGLRQQLVYWRKEAVRRGYVAFIIDSFSARGSASCRPMPPVSLARGVKDVLQAADQLRAFPFVDKSRVAMIGVSWGAIVGLATASPAYVAGSSGYVGPAAHLDAVVSLYPLCRSTQGAELVQPDTSTPTLVLMGGQDTETPAEPCVNALQPLRERNAPVEWHVFPTATHCWDCSDQNGQRWSPPWAGGRAVIYLYDGKVTEESADRAFDFLSRHLKTEPKQ